MTIHEDGAERSGPSPVRFNFTVNDASLKDTTDVALFDRVLSGDRPFAWGFHGPARVGLDVPNPEVLDDYLPPDGSAVRSVQLVQSSEVIAEGVGYSAQVFFSEGWMVVRVAAESPERARRVGESILTRIRAAEPSGPAPDPSVVPILSWSADGRGPRTRDARIRAGAWSEVSRNYPASTRRQLSSLVGLRLTQEHSNHGRLILFHGPPGVGKTRVIRTLAREWADWCEFEAFVDPERLFAEAHYLSAVIERPAPSDRHATDQRRFRCLVLEDADRYLLGADTGGPAVGRLLSTADGFLRPASVLILLSTNVPASRLVPALLRPGRCLASIEFRLFEPAEARDWLSGEYRAPSVPMSLAELFQASGATAKIEEASTWSTGQYL